MCMMYCFVWVFCCCLFQPSLNGEEKSSNKQSSSKQMNGTGVWGKLLLYCVNVHFSGLLCSVRDKILQPSEIGRAGGL